MNGGIVVSRYLSRAKDPWSSMTHLWGAVLSLVGTILLVGRGLQQGAGPDLISAAAVFGFSLMALYTASATYHYVRAAPNVNLILRKLDHSMIFVLIAGTYTPILAFIIPAPGSTVIMAAIWAITAAGIIMKMIWMNAPRWLYTLFYVLMGWGIAAELPYIYGISPGCAVWMVIGGILYTIGAVMYAVKKPNILSGFGFHEIFHVFIILGSVGHYIAIAFYV